MVSEEFIQRWVRRVRHEVPDGVAVFLVGSYARGDAGPYSDVDLDVLVADRPQRVADLLDVEGQRLVCVSVWIRDAATWLASQQESQGWAFGLAAVETVGCVGSPTTPGEHDWSDHSWPIRRASRNWTTWSATWARWPTPIAEAMSLAGGWLPRILPGPVHRCCNRSIRILGLQPSCSAARGPGLRRGSTRLPRRPVGLPGACWPADQRRGGLWRRVSPPGTGVVELLGSDADRLTRLLPEPLAASLTDGADAATSPNSSGTHPLRRRIAMRA
jgi:hypothetical protein